MKIVYISSSTIPSRTANSIHVMKMCQAFAKNGHEIVLVAPDDVRNYEESGVEDVYSYYGIDSCFEIIKLPILPVIGWQKIYACMAALKAFRLKCDLVYCRSNPGSVFAVLFRLPIIVELHAPFGTRSRVLDWAARRLFSSKYIIKIVVITHSLRKYFEMTYTSSGTKIIVAPDGADPVRVGVEPVVIPFSGGRLQVGYVGHLYAGKGMEVVGELAAQCLWADFHVVGGTKEDVAYWKNRCSSCTNITFHGYVAHEFVSAYIQAFDVVLLPNQKKVAPHGGKGNIGDWTSPLKAFEYMAAGKPILCSDLPVLREIFEHERNALLCAFDDVTQWARALIRLRDDRKIRERLGKTAQKDFLENCTWSMRAQKILEVIG